MADLTQTIPLKCPGHDLRVTNCEGALWHLSFLTIIFQISFTYLLICYKRIILGNNQKALYGVVSVAAKSWNHYLTGQQDKINKTRHVRT